MVNTEAIVQNLMNRRVNGKPPNALYILKALIELGSGWHSFKEVLTKAIETSGNTKMKYYPIQDVIKLRLAELSFPKGVSAREAQIRLIPEYEEQISRLIASMS